MIRRIIYSGLLIIILGLLLLYGSSYRGYVLILVGPYRIESSVVGIFLVGVVLWIFCSTIRYLLGRLFRIGGWLKCRRQMRAQQQLLLGLLKSIEGDYAEAEKHFLQSAVESESSDLLYLLAADAARHQGRWQQMKSYLSTLAYEDNSPHTLALQISWARAQLATQPATMVAPHIHFLLQKAPKHPMVCQLAQQLNQPSSLRDEFSCNA